MLYSVVLVVYALYFRCIFGCIKIYIYNMTDKPKKVMTDKQKAARMANLAKGREKRMASIKQKKKDDINEVELSSEKDSSSDEEDFIITKKKPIKKKEIVEVPKIKEPDRSSEFDELKNMVIQLASMQKKQNKKNKERKSGGTKIVLLPNNQPQNNQDNGAMEVLRRSLWGN